MGNQRGSQLLQDARTLGVGDQEEQERPQGKRKGPVIRGIELGTSAINIHLEWD